MACSGVQLLVEAVLIQFPGHQLSRYHRVLLTILEDKSHAIGNDELVTLLQEPGTHQNPQALADCIDLAFRARHPRIYAPAESPVEPKAIVFNCVWINLNPQDREKDEAVNIFKEGLDTSENAPYLTDPKHLRLLESPSSSLQGDALQGVGKSTTEFYVWTIQMGRLSSGSESESVV